MRNSAVKLLAAAFAVGAMIVSIAPASATPLAGAAAIASVAPPALTDQVYYRHGFHHHHRFHHRRPFHHHRHGYRHGIPGHPIRRALRAL